MNRSRESPSWMHAVIEEHAHQLGRGSAPKLAYTQGLEDIYTIEEIDVSTIRPMTAQQKVSYEPQVKKEPPAQLPLNFGEEYSYDGTQRIDLYTLQKDPQKTFRIFVIPWIRRRNGLATKDEIVERLERVSGDPSKLSAILNSIEIPLQEVVYGLYCSDDHIKIVYNQIVACAQSYFYRSVSYPLQSLIAWIEREFAREWIGFPEGFVEKTLRYCPDFLVYKSAEEGISITRRLVPHQLYSDNLGCVKAP